MRPRPFHSLFSYGGISPAPTIRVRGDGVLRIKLRNVLGLDEGVTPTTVRLEATKTWSPFATGGWSTRSTEYEIVAYPPDAAGTESVRQVKTINMKQSSRGGKMFFDFKRIEPAK